MSQSKKTLVLGASDNPSRYSYLAIRRLAAHQYPVVAIGRKTGEVSGVPIATEAAPVEGIDTVTLYLNPQNQKPYYEYILGLKPRRIIFNPGTENDELIEKAESAGIEPVIACTLVMLSTGQY
ncbi:CoA-binding protein [Flaviaesturariibacter flavus]|uniref:CoA-binding protein n=1 Tax=Flaviaesturariibacter flavus TaxID=2502780 RepID=A0A4R1B8I1_9BACT|nr:CoA-binding protein [Flaviaesturariibacter flavus]TCJ13358.1 CoA-binding protein [Flaviaesturariibacter flavus]